MLISVKPWGLSGCSANLLLVFSTRKKLLGWGAQASWHPRSRRPHHRPQTSQENLNFGYRYKQETLFCSLRRETHNGSYKLLYSPLRQWLAFDLLMDPYGISNQRTRHQEESRYKRIHN